MIKYYYTPQELAGLPGLPQTARRVRTKAKDDQWICQPKSKGKGSEYSVESLPAETQQFLAQQAFAEQARIAKAQSRQAGIEAAKKLLLEKEMHQEINARKAQQVLAKAAHLKGIDKERYESKVFMLEFWCTYIEQSSESKTKATQEFLTLWQHKQLPYITEELAFIYCHVSPKLSYQTLMRWQSNPELLLPKYGNRKNNGIIDNNEELKEFVIATLFNFPDIKPNLLKDAVDARFRTSLKVRPSIKTLERWVKNYIANNQQVYNAITAPDKWRNHNLPAFGTLSVDTLNGVWQLDSTPADIMLTDGRHNLLGAIDIYTRRMKLIVSKTSTSEAVANLLRRCILDWGVPDAVKTDNGQDYISVRTKTALKSLGVQQIVSQPFSPWEKGNVERMFRTFSHSLLELMPGFIGHNVAERNVIENRKEFSARLFKKDKVIEINMSAAELQRFADRWVDDIYMHRPHSGEDMQGQTPFSRVANWDKPIRTIKDERALDILLSDVGERTVGKSGIRLDGLLYIAPELGARVGDVVLVRKDPDCVGTIYVFKNSEFICIAEDTRYVGINRQAIAQKARQNAMSERKELKKQIKAAQSKQKVKDIAEEILQDKHQLNNVVSLPKATVAYNNTEIDSAIEASNMVATLDTNAPITSQITPTEVTALPIVNNPQDVHRRYLRLKQKLEKSEKLNQEDTRFYGWYHNSNECIDMQEFFDDFGLTATVNQ